MGYKKDAKWVLEIQEKLAIPLIYNQVWPKCEIKCLDDDEDDKLKKILDVSGADKLIKWKNGTVSFLGQRFRRYKSSLARGYDDFTLRKERPKTDYKAECYKIIDAIENGKLLAAYYAYGHVNTDETGFEKFRILHFRIFIEKWVNEELNPCQQPYNKDHSSNFYAWPFNQIPHECIHWELKDPITLSDTSSPSDYAQFTLADFMRGGTPND